MPDNRPDVQSSLRIIQSTQCKGATKGYLKDPIFKELIKPYYCFSADPTYYGQYFQNYLTANKGFPQILEYVPCYYQNLSTIKSLAKDKAQYDDSGNYENLVCLLQEL